MADKKRLIKFKAIKTIKKPVNVSFKTKAGGTVSFKAIKTFKKPTTVKFYARKRKK